MKEKKEEKDGRKRKKERKTNTSCPEAITSGLPVPLRCDHLLPGLMEDWKVSAQVFSGGLAVLSGDSILQQRCCVTTPLANQTLPAFTRESLICMPLLWNRAWGYSRNFSHGNYSSGLPCCRQWRTLELEGNTRWQLSRVVRRLHDLDWGRRMKMMI